MQELRVETWRGEAVEGLHRVSAVVMDAAGRRVAWMADPGLPIFMPSAAKPFQAIPRVAEVAPWVFKKRARRGVPVDQPRPVWS